MFTLLGNKSRIMKIWLSWLVGWLVDSSANKRFVGLFNTKVSLRMMVSYYIQYKNVSSQTDTSYLAWPSVF